MANPNIGSYLKDLRLRKGYSIERLSTETKISLSILKKLENNELTALPNITYVKGYVQNIFKTLHVTFGPQEIELIDNTYISLGLMKQPDPAGGLEKSNILTTQNLPTSSQQSPISNKGSVYNIESLKSKRIIFAIVSIFALLGIFRFIQKIDQQPDLRQTQVKNSPIIKPNIVEATASSNVAVVVNTSQTTPLPTPSSIDLNDAHLVAATSAMTPVPSPTPNPTSTTLNSTYPKYEFKKIINLAVSIDTSSVENTDYSVYTQEDRKKVSPGKENVFITKLEGDSWISYKKNDEPARSVLLKVGQKFFITGDKLFLTIGNTKGLKIFYNNQLVQFVDTRGVKSFIFPLADAGQHSLPFFVRDAKDKLYFYLDYIPLMNQEPSAASEANKPILP